MLSAFLSLARPVAMKALSNPNVLGSLLVGTVGAQQANEIQKSLSLGEISLDDIYDSLVNFTASPAVSALVNTPEGTFSAPDPKEIEEQQRIWRELGKQITLPSDTLPKILSTPEPEELPNITSNPIPPEEKVSVGDIGFTPTPALRLEDMIMTAKDPDQIRQEEWFQKVLGMAQGDPNIDYKEKDIKSGDFIMDAPQANTFWTRAGFPGETFNSAKSVIIYVKPKDYLELAEEKKAGYNEPNDRALELYSNTNIGLTVPKLQMYENENGVFEVKGHEGTHRAYYFNKLDPDTPIPVQVQFTNRGSNEYIDYTRGYYKHGQSVLNAGKKLQESDFVIDEDGNSINISVFGYEGDGQKIGEIFEKGDISKTNETKSITTSQGEEGTKQITQTLESPITVSGSELQQSNQGRETTVSGNVPLVKASQEQGVTFFSDILDGELYVPKKQYEDLVDTSQANEATQIWNEKRNGNFENHIFTSIPTFKEAQIVTADAIAKTLPKGGTIIDIGGTEGGFINTIAELNPSIEGIVLDPNPKAEESFLEQKMPNTEFIKEAFTTNPEEFGQYAFTERGQDINFFDANEIPDNSVDAFSEKMVFQFIDNQREDKVKLIKQKLTPDGFAVFEEKFFTSKEDPVWQENEAKKNEFKLQYYDPYQVTEKEEKVLTGMNERQVSSESFEKILMNNFNNVVQYWDSGNFNGYVVSDSADTINSFLGNMVDLNSEYSNVQTPRFVTRTIDKKRKGGPISIPKIDQL